VKTKPLKLKHLVGVDTRMGVDDNDYLPPFRFTGKLAKLTIKLEKQP
jgi:arylsulfatase